MDNKMSQKRVLIIVIAAGTLVFPISFFLALSILQKFGVELNNTQTKIALIMTLLICYLASISAAKRTIKKRMKKDIN